MRRFVLGLMLCMFFVVPAYATVDWDEGFEYSGGSINAMNNAMDAVWSTSCAGNSVIIAPTTQALSGGGPAPHGGTKYLMETFRGTEGVTPGFQSCFKDRNLTAPTTGTLYTRFWIYIPSSFQTGTPTTKITLTPAYASDAFTTVWWAMIGVGRAVLDHLRDALRVRRVGLHLAQHHAGMVSPGAVGLGPGNATVPDCFHQGVLRGV